MSISMGIQHRATGEHEVVPIATNATFRRVWLPACERLGLEHVALFYGGALLAFDANLARVIVSELERLRAWAASPEGDEDGEYLVERCDLLLGAFARIDLEACDLDIG